MQILKDIPKEEYNKFYEIQKKIALENKETLYPQSLTKDKTKENNSFINRFDLAISKEILSEKKVLDYLKKMKVNSSNFVNIENIKYPIIIKFYKDDTFIKILRCTGNLSKMLDKVKKDYDYNKYSYIYIPENHIDQVLEFSILFENPLLTNTYCIRKPVVYNTIKAISKRINFEKNININSKKIIKILDKHKIDYFIRDFNRIFVDVREAIKKINAEMEG